MGSEPYRFGRFTLDPANQELSADGTPIPLGATDFRLLLALIEGAGSLVTKDELMSRVWGKAAVGDNTLHVHITALRKALGDGFIATKQGRGYRFLEHTGQTGTASRHHAGNLPACSANGSKGSTSRLIGRDTQIGALSDLLAHNLLVTLVGPGGVGKTRLALEVANEGASTFKDGAWLVELRQVKDKISIPNGHGCVGQLISLPCGAVLTLEGQATARLWRARLSVAVLPYLLRHGVPIRYSYVRRDWALTSYQTVFAQRPGSAEMPSASRPFTPSVVTQLVARGVLIAPLTLHAGVSSLEADEDPYPEPYDVPPATARLVNHVRAHGGRVIAAGTTVVRALETAALPAGPDPSRDPGDPRDLSDP